MNSERFLLALSAIAAIVASADAYPRTVDLADPAINKTVCPIRVEVDCDPERVPRRIKQMKCAANPNKWCQEQRIAKRECCEHSHSRHVMECVEIHDTVLVYYPRGEAPHEPKTYEVAVGCTCMIERSQRASTVVPPT